jgi:hypothetical protein
MTAERIVDQYGHRWPVTGAWCRLCGFPLANIGQDAHPNCMTPTGVPWTKGQKLENN